MYIRKTCAIACSVTVIALVYIHMQMGIYGLAYEQERHTRNIRELVEKNGNATYAILRLKSANHIGEALLQKDSPLQFVSPIILLRYPRQSRFLLKHSRLHLFPAHKSCHR